MKTTNPIVYCIIGILLMLCIAIISIVLTILYFFNVSLGIRISMVFFSAISLYALVVVVIINILKFQDIRRERKQSSISKLLILLPIPFILFSCRTSSHLLPEQSMFIIKDTTVVTPLPKVFPIHASMSLSQISSDTFVIENSYSRASIWLEDHKIKAVLISKDTTIPVLVKGGRTERTVIQRVPVLEKKGVPKWAWELVFYFSGLFFLFFLFRFIGKKIGVL